MPLPGPIIRALKNAERTQQDAEKGVSGDGTGSDGGSLGIGGTPPREELRRLQAMHHPEGGGGNSDGSSASRFGGRLPITHTDQFAARYGSGYSVYWSRFDEALRDSWPNALAMRRSAFIQELISHRQLPVVSLPWHIEVDDPKDVDQQRAAERLTQLVDAIPRFQSMRLYLAEAIWQGKHGSQLAWGRVMIDGKSGVTITDHEPVDGDSIVYKYDKTPGILVRSDWVPGSDHDNRFIESPDKNWIQQADRGRAIFLYDQFWRDHFVIQNFSPSSTDFYFEGDKAASIFGVGFRSRLYWDFQFREELRSWRSDALQRIGVNGMLYGFYESGNPASMKAVIQSLKLIIRDNVTAFPVEKGSEPQEIKHIEPSAVGYEVINQCVSDLEDTMRRAVLGQSLSSEAQATGLGSGVADLHKSTFEHIIRYDAISQQETLTKDILGPMVRFNDWEYKGEVLRGNLPFRCRLVYSIDKANVQERSQVIFGAYDRGFELDREQCYDDLGLASPKDPANVLKKPEPVPGASAPGDDSADSPPLGGVPAAPKYGIRHRLSGGFEVHRPKSPVPLPESVA